MVALVTGVWWLGLVEFALHAAIDYDKCDGNLSFNQDQVLHIASKVMLVMYAVIV